MRPATSPSYTGRVPLNARSARARYVVRAMRWQVIALGTALGGTLVAVSHLVEVGPFASAHLGVGFGVIGIALGAAFTLDDPAATTLEAVPATVRQQTLLRATLTAAIGVLALAGLALLAWKPLAYLALLVQAGGLAAIGMTGTAVTGRIMGRQSPGAFGGTAVAGFVIADTVGALPGEQAVLAGGATAAHGPEVAWLWVAVAVLATVGTTWATSDPANRRRHRERKATR